MPSKMIRFPYKIRITHSQFNYNGICYSNKDTLDTVEAFVYFTFLFSYKNEFMPIRALSTVACERYKPFLQFQNAAVIDSYCVSAFLVNFLEPCWHAAWSEEWDLFLWWNEAFLQTSFISFYLLYEDAFSEIGFSHCCNCFYEPEFHALLECRVCIQISNYVHLPSYTAWASWIETKGTAILLHHYYLSRLEHY